MKTVILSLLLFGFASAQYTEAEVLQMIQDRDQQWQVKVNDLEKLVEQQNKQMFTQESLISKQQSQIEIDSLLIKTKNDQIELLSKRDEANEKLVSLVKPRWYENRYLWFVAGFVLGK